MPSSFQIGPLVAPLLSSSIITSDHFGVNTLLSYKDLADPDDRLSESLAEMNPGRLRYPGGAITETYSEQIMDHVLNGTRDPALWEGLADGPVFLGDILDRAAEMNAAISVVVPTVNAFEKSAAQALSDGTYGSRSLRTAEAVQSGSFTTQLLQFANAVERSQQDGYTYVAPNWEGDYLREVRQFVSNVMQMADDAGVRVSAFEIGNEFWGSGEMTASEYGNLAGQVANALAHDFDTNTFAGYVSDQAAPELLVQSLVAAGSYSPNGARSVDMDGDTYLVPSQGGASNQNNTLIQAINSLDAGDHIDGVINHYYDRFGLQGVDNTKFVFKQLNRWAEDLDRSDELDDLTFHITEWDVGTGDQDNGGLQQAHMLLEQFYNMIQNGIDGADIWPLHFYKVQGTSLTDDTTQELAMGGEIFRMMSESLIGLSPVLDWEVAGEIDVHGYADDDRLVLFVGERSGLDRTDVEIDLSALGVGLGQFRSAVMLSNDLPDTVNPDSGQFANGLPVFQVLDAADVFAPSEPDHLQIDMEDWSILQIEFSIEAPNTTPQLDVSQAAAIAEFETKDSTVFDALSEPEAEQEAQTDEMHLVMQQLMSDVLS